MPTPWARSARWSTHQFGDTVAAEEGFPVDGATDAHSADPVMMVSELDALTDADENRTNGADTATFETDSDGEGDDDEGLAGTDLLTPGVAGSAATALGANTGFTAETTVVTMGRVKRESGASRQGEVVTKLAAHMSLTVTATVENAEGITQVPVIADDGLAG